MDHIWIMLKHDYNLLSVLVVTIQPIHKLAHVYWLSTLLNCLKALAVI